MRILYWSDLYWPYVGGPELFGRRLLPALRARGHDVQVVTSHDHLALPDRAEVDGIPIHRFSMRAPLADGDLGRVAEVARQVSTLKRGLRPDVIHLSGVGPSVMFHLATHRAVPAPFVVSLRTEVLASQKAGPGTVLDRVLQRAAWTTAVSARVLDQARQLVPGLAGRSSVVYSFVDEPDRPVRPLPFDPTVVCLGRLIPAKGFDLAVAAMPRVLAHCPGARLILAGEGPERSSLERLAAELGVNDSVRMPGGVPPDSVPDLLDSATVVVVPSRREGLPMVALEAAFRSRPVVATDIGGLPEAVLHGRTGLLVPPDDVSALAAAIGTVLGAPQEAAEWGRRGRERVRERFTRERCVEAYLGIYERLGRGHRTPDAAPVVVTGSGEGTRGARSAVRS